MKKLLSLLSIFAIVLSCSSDETSTPVTPPPASIAKYTITLSAGEGGTVSTTGGEYESGQTVNVTATPQGEYVFASWSDGNTDATRTITVSSNSTLTANFEKRKYPLTLNFEGEGDVLEEILSSGRSTDYDSGTKVKLTALPSQGWEFVENNGWDFIGWTGDIQSSDSIITVNINEGITITAVFEQKPFPYSINWDNLIENVEGTSKIVYDKTLETIERNKTIDGYNNVPYKVYRGPNLDDKHYVNFDLWLDDLFGLYAKALKPDSQTFIMFPYEDLEWAVDLLSSEEVNQPGYETVMRNANQNENQGVRQNMVPNQPAGRADGIWVLPATLGPVVGAYESWEQHEESTLNHEYGHQAQSTQWKEPDMSAPGGGMNAPCFLIEGIVTIPELVLIFDTSDKFEQSIKGRIRGAFTSDPTTLDELGNFTGYAPFNEEVTIDFAINYLQGSLRANNPNCNQGLYYGLSYSMGYLATEALVAIGGVESPMALFRLMGNKKMTWEQAFEDIYRIPWSEAAPILAEYIYISDGIINNN